MAHVGVDTNGSGGSGADDSGGGGSAAPASPCANDSPCADDSGGGGSATPANPCDDDDGKIFGVYNTMDNPDQFPKTKRLSSLDFEIPLQGQRWVLFNAGGPGLKLHAKSFRIRILGFYASRKQGLQAARELARDVHDVDMLLAPLDAPLYLCDPSVVAGNNAGLDNVLDPDRTSQIIAAWEAFLHAREDDVRDITAKHEAKSDVGLPYNFDTVRALDAESHADGADADDDDGTEDDADNAEVGSDHADGDRDVCSAPMFVPYGWRPSNHCCAVIMACWPVVGDGNVREQLVLQKEWVISMYGGHCTNDDAVAFASDVLQHERPRIGRAATVPMYEWIILDWLSSGYLKYVTKSIYATQFGTDLHANDGVDKAADLWRTKCNSDY